MRRHALRAENGTLIVKSDQSDFVSVGNVRAISDILALMCELPDGRRVAVPKTSLGPGSQVRRPGDVGTLVLRREYAERLGLVAWS